jgi:lipopolysaccharide biosynthesis protein
VRIGVHGHFFYPELAHDFVDRLRRGSHELELMLTTDTEAKAERLRDEIVADGGIRSVGVMVVPNRGRDIGPLLTALGREWMQQFDLVLHAHGKRSLHVRGGDSWREFLWASLVGADVDAAWVPTLDTVVRAFQTTPGLGLVFAEEATLFGWEQNRVIAGDLLRRMGMPAPPTNFDFPVGTMFWFRPSALLPLLDLGLDWSDYPLEPTPIDGTILHAIERLIPFVAEGAGYHFATTYIDDITRDAIGAASEDVDD